MSDVMDGFSPVNYVSKRIQDAMLPHPNSLMVFFPQSFIYFKPKDIVSGDFYWFSEHENKFLIAVADCTGHGVPGGARVSAGRRRADDRLERDRTIGPAIREALSRGARADGHVAGGCVGVAGFRHAAGALEPPGRALGGHAGVLGDQKQ